MSILDTMKERYTAKRYNCDKPLTAEQIDQLEQMLQLAPSSTNAQPWHFTIATTPEGRGRIAKATESNYPFNFKKTANSPMVVVLEAANSVSDEWLEQVLIQEVKDGRMKSIDDEDAKNMAFGRKMFRDIHTKLGDERQWADKQVYLNAGNFILGAGALGLNTTVMEGVDFEMLDTELGLAEKGFHSILVITVGYGDEDDRNRTAPKSRMDRDVLIDRI